MDAENDLVAQGNLIHPNYLQYQSIGDTKLSYQLTSKELKETTEIVEEWFYNNSECI